MIKTKKFNLKLTEKEYALLKKLAHVRNTSMAEIVRQLIADFVKNSRLK